MGHPSSKGFNVVKDHSHSGRCKVKNVRGKLRTFSWTIIGSSKRFLIPSHMMKKLKE